jgi:tetratricopeptide (TPR) repeat protein
MHMLRRVRRDVAAAVAAYAAVLRAAPLALEALEALARLGASEEEVRALLPAPQHAAPAAPHAAAATSAAAAAAPLSAAEPCTWLPLLASAHCALARAAGGADARAAAAAARATTALCGGASACVAASSSFPFPHAPPLLRLAGAAHAAACAPSAAVACFDAAHAADAGCAAHAASHAHALRARRDVQSLSSAARRLLISAPSHPETWALASARFEAGGDASRALCAADSGLRLDARCAACAVARGRALAMLGRPRAAAGAFRAALARAPDDAAFDGLVRALLRCAAPPAPGAAVMAPAAALAAAHSARRAAADAASVAAAAAAALPRSPLAATLPGVVAAALGDPLRAQSLLEQCLEAHHAPHDRHFGTATSAAAAAPLFALAALHASQRRFEDAAALLTGAADSIGTTRDDDADVAHVAALQCRLGALRALQRRLPDAAAHFAAALAALPAHADARRGTERVRRMQRAAAEQHHAGGGGGASGAAAAAAAAREDAALMRLLRDEGGEADVADIHDEEEEGDDDDDDGDDDESSDDMA